MFPKGIVATSLMEHHKFRQLGVSRLNCLECAAIFRNVRLTVRCRLGDYTKTMTTARFLMISAAVMAGAATLSAAQAQQGYPVPPGAYSPAPQPYPPGYPSDYRGPGVPNFEELDDEEAIRQRYRRPAPPVRSCRRTIPVTPTQSRAGRAR